MLTCNFSFHFKLLPISSNPMPLCHLLVMETVVIHRQGTIAMTGRAHCQRQVAFLLHTSTAHRSVKIGIVF